MGWGICEKLSHTTNYQGGRECLKSPAGGEMRERGDLGSYNTGDSCAPLTFLKRGSVKTFLKRRVKKGCVLDKISGLCGQTHFANTKGQQFTFLKVPIQRTTDAT